MPELQIITEEQWERVQQHLKQIGARFKAHEVGGFHPEQGIPFQRVVGLRAMWRQNQCDSQPGKEIRGQVCSLWLP